MFEVSVEFQAAQLSMLSLLAFCPADSGDWKCLVVLVCFLAIFGMFSGLYVGTCWPCIWNLSVYGHVNGIFLA